MGNFSFFIYGAVFGVLGLMAVVTAVRNYQIRQATAEIKRIIDRGVVTGIDSFESLVRFDECINDWNTLGVKHRSGEIRIQGEDIDSFDSLIANVMASGEVNEAVVDNIESKLAEIKTRIVVR